MFLSRTDYDRGVNTFSPEGRLFQVEYAREAIKLGSTAVGIRTPEGVVLAVEKRLTSTLIIPKSVDKVIEIDHHLGVAMSGLVADARILIDKARVEAANHVFTYNEKIKVRSVAQGISDVAMGFGKGEDMPSRPFGVALLLAGVDEEGPQLYHIGPSGSFIQWEAKSIGSGGEGAQNALQEDYRPDLTLEEGIKMALTVLKQVMEDAVDEKNVEVATVTSGHGYQVMGSEDLLRHIGGLGDGDE